MSLIHESKYLGELYIADTFMKRFWGFMFRKAPHYEAIMIKPCNSIHTFFMKFEIDVIFLNKNMKVIKKVDALKPCKMVMPIKEGAVVIEAKAGKFKSIKIGDIISIAQVNRID
jgi:uncharacterized membrane protein (UPF0127 family)